MDLSAASLLALRNVNTQAEVASRVLRKVLDIQQSQAADLVALVDQGQGIGQNLSVIG